MNIKLCKSVFFIFLLIHLINTFTSKIIHSKLRFVEEKNYFLQDDIMRSKNNKLINNYLSTKYLYWSKGYKGEKIKLGIMDSGINNKNIKCNLKKSKNFSDDNFDIDYIGHGTYLSSIICSEEIGISPKIDLYMYKIFNKEGDTNTKWIINALNEILNDEINILNMSFGGINFNDKKIILLIKEIVNKNIIIISSSGNEGPSFGSISFPGNNINIITVGGVSNEIFTIYKYSSRGPAMYSNNIIIPKPNTWTLGEDIIGFNHKNKDFVIKNGSSVSSAIVSSFIALFLSGDLNNLNYWNSAKIIEIIRLSNIELPEINLFERFSGLFNPQGLLGFLDINYKNLFLDKMKLFNYDYLKNVNYNNQRYFDNYNYNIDFYATKQPVNIPLIVLNFMDKSDYNKIKLPFKFEISIIKKKNKKDDLSEIITKNCINIIIDDIESISLIFLLNMKIIFNDNPQCNFYKQNINWDIKFFDSQNNNLFDLYYSFNFIPKPLKYNRILFDHYHQLIYPYDGAIPKDYLLKNNFDYDWTYENMDTNFFSLKKYILENEEYYIEEINEPLSCINLEDYSVLLIIDTEKKMSLKEITKLKYSYENHGLSIFIISEWNNILISANLNYSNQKDKNKNKEIKIKKEGANLSNLNSFLLNYNIALTRDSLSGEIYISNQKIEINSGSSIGLFPENGILFGGTFSNDEQFISNKAITELSRAILGLYENKNNENYGRIAIFTDSFCIDDYQLSIEKKEKNCFCLFKDILTFLIHGNYAYNNLNLLNSKILDKKYYNGENIQYDTFNNEINENEKCMNKINFPKLFTENKNLKFKTNNFSNEEITMEIPNIFTNKLRMDSLINNNNILEMMKGLLLIFIPICGILIILLIIIKYKVENNRKRRISAIQTLGEIRPLMIRVNQRKRMNSISSDTPLSLELKNEKV